MSHRSQMIQQLAPYDKVLAIGWVYLKLTNYWKLFNNTGFLVRSSGGSYYLLCDGVIEKTGVRAVFQRPVNVTQYKIILNAVRLMTDSGEIYFVPVEINPIRLNNPTILARATAKDAILKIKSTGELKVHEECPICGLIRPAEQPQCSNPECAPRLAVMMPAEKSKTTLLKYLKWVAPVAALSYVFVLLADLLAQGTHWSPETVSFLDKLRTPLLVIGILGYLGINLAKHLMKKDQHLE